MDGLAPIARQTGPHAGPFKAAQSYGPADDLLFHGRDADGASLAQFLADRPFAVLTAPSGTGKTSLLQAKVMPLLEYERWFTVYARPHGDPDASLRSALCAHLLPDPRDEAAVVARWMTAAPRGPASTLIEASEWYAGLPIEDRVNYRHFANASSEAEPLPMVCRLLRGTILLNDLIEHFEALGADGPALGLSPLTSLRAFAATLAKPSTLACWEGWCSRFHDGGGLSQALQVFQEEWSPLRPGVTGAVLVLDQVEELFTQHPIGTIEQFLADTKQWFMHFGDTESRRPVHLTLALRKEFFADVVPHLHAFGTVERLAFFLGSMTGEQARDALSKPARLYGIEFEPPFNHSDDAVGCLGRVLSLAIEDGSTLSQADLLPAAQPQNPLASDLPAGRFAPSLISLIGAHLWAQLQLAEPPVAMPLDWAEFQRLVPQLDDVFAAFLKDALARFGAEDGAPNASGTVTMFDALELLDHLVTSTGYRNIVAEVELIDQLPLPAALARQLIDDMDQQAKLIRRESRGRSRFVEITHERLIAPVRRLLAEMRQQDVLRAALGPAHDMIHMLPDDPDPTRDPLPSPHLREALVRHMNRANLDRLAAKHLLRSLICAGPDDEGSIAGFGNEAPTRWKSALIDLAARLDDRTRDSHGRLPLVPESELDPVVAALSNDGTHFDGATLRHLVVSTLADRSSAAGERIRRTFRALAVLEYRL